MEHTIAFLIKHCFMFTVYWQINMFFSLLIFLSVFSIALELFCLELFNVYTPLHVVLAV